MMTLPGSPAGCTRRTVRAQRSSSVPHLARARPGEDVVDQQHRAGDGAAGLAHGAAELEIVSQEVGEALEAADPGQQVRAQGHGRAQHRMGAPGLADDDAGGEAAVDVQRRPAWTRRWRSGSRGKGNEAPPT